MLCSDSYKNMHLMYPDDEKDSDSDDHSQVHHDIDGSSKAGESVQKLY